VPELQRPPPPYQQIAQHYRDQITSGELRDGDRLPAARQLVQQWRVAHATAARVLSTLRDEGLAETTPGGGGGTVVRVRSPAPSANEPAPPSLADCVAAAQAGRVTYLGTDEPVAAVVPLDVARAGLAALGRAEPDQTAR